MTIIILSVLFIIIILFSTHEWPLQWWRGWAAWDMGDDWNV